MIYIWVSKYLARIPLSSKASLLKFHQHASVLVKNFAKYKRIYTYYCVVLLSTGLVASCCASYSPVCSIRTLCFFSCLSCRLVGKYQMSDRPPSNLHQTSCVKRPTVILIPAMCRQYTNCYKHVVSTHLMSCSHICKNGQLYETTKLTQELAVKLEQGETFVSGTQWQTEK